MGLSIYYRYKIRTAADAARKLVRRLHAFARTLPFEQVTEIEEYDPPDGVFVFDKGERPADWKPGDHYMTRKRDDGRDETVRVPSLHAMSFMCNIRGSETAEFGLASHPPVVIHHEDVVTHTEDGGEQRLLGGGDPIEFPTRLRGWYSFSHCCKTQYAANPKYGGVENFLHAHLSVFSMIDECKRLGMTTRIRDDAKYWRHRSEKKLVAELVRWDELIASFVGGLSDKLGDKAGAIVAPIKDRPEFEHLEAKGVARMRKAAKAWQQRKKRKPKKQ